jgi:hypothetical protein
MGDPTQLLDLVGSTSTQRLTKFFVDHGIHGLLYDALSRFEVGSNHPDLLKAMQRLSHLEASRSLLHEGEVKRVDAALKRTDIRCLALKGTPLAYTTYPSPALRPRADIDLLFDDTDIVAARQLLTSLGYQCQPLVTPLDQSVFLTTQFTCIRHVKDQPSRVIDAHWRISNSLLFASMFGFDELYQTAAPISRLTDAIKAPDAVHCLLIACLHRVTESHKDRMIWIYDIHLLLQQSSTQQIAQAAEIAVDRGLASVLLDGLVAARDGFSTVIDPALLQMLIEAKSNNAEPAERLLHADGMLARRRAELSAVKGWRQRLRMLRVSLFPPKSYLALQGLTPGHAPWIWAYVKRLACALRPGHRRV